MTLGILAVSPAAAGVSIAVKTDKELYLQGETLKATVYFPSSLNTVASLDMNLSYDSSKLQIVDVTNGKELDDAIKAQTDGRVFSESHSKAGTVLWSLAATNSFDFKGTFAVAEFVVKSRADGGEATLSLEITNASNADRAQITNSLTTQNAVFEIKKVAANDLAFERTEDGKAYNIAGYHCITVDNLTIPSQYAGLPVIGIADDVFVNHAELKTVILPDTVKSVGKNAFAGCAGISEIVIPDSVETIGEGAFSDCYNLKKITLPMGLEKIEAGTFTDCSYLSEIDIPFTVTEIGTEAFKNCYSLEKIKISKNTSEIAADAFSEIGYRPVFVTVEENTYLPSYISENITDAKITYVKDLSLGEASLSETEFSCTGSEIRPSVAVKLDSGEEVSADVQYRVVYKDNTDHGTAKVYVAGIDEYGEGYVLTFSIACLHPDREKTIGREATCTEDGYYNLTCTECGDIITEKIPAFGHTERAWVVDVNPTIYKTGLKHGVCIYCGAVMSENIIIPKVFPDLNNDRKINSGDALIVLQYAVEMENKLRTPQLLMAADTNGDGEINSVDALNILQISIGQIVIDGYTP